MTTSAIMLLILVVWFFALFSGASIYVMMALAGAAFVYVAGIDLIVLPQKFTKAADSFPLLAAPMYILMGSLMNSSGVTVRIFRFATVCVGWWKGGLCHANILGSVIFAGMSGSAVADAGGIGVIEIKAMRDAGYDGETAAAITAASATIDAARDWLYGSATGDWVSMAVASDGSYGVPEGLISSFPVTTNNGDWEIVQGLEINDFSRSKIDASVAELAEERDAVKELGLI